MGTELVPETLYSNELTRLCAREDYVLPVPHFCTIMCHATQTCMPGNSWQGTASQEFLICLTHQIWSPTTSFSSWGSILPWRGNNFKTLRRYNWIRHGTMNQAYHTCNEEWKDHWNHCIEVGSHFEEDNSEYILGTSRFPDYMLSWIFPISLHTSHKTRCYLISF